MKKEGGEKRGEWKYNEEGTNYTVHTHGITTRTPTCYTNSKCCFLKE
jgi:hypothetical protein